MTGRRRRARCRPLNDDEGSVLPLLSAFVAIALALILTVAAAASLYLERSRLLTVADGAALAAAEAFDLGDARLSEGGVVPRLAEGPAVAAAGGYLAQDPDPKSDDVVIVSVAVEDGRSATVVVGTVWRPPVLTAFLPDGIAIEAASTARSVFR